jgi:adenosylhomocysteine nucleosidase
VIIAGVGKDRAREAAELLFEEHGPSVLVSLGYAGALSPELKRGDIVLSAYSMNQHQGQPRAMDVAFEERLRGIADESHEHHVYVGPLYTADKIVARHEEKKEIFEKTNAPIVDMESFSVYQVARNQGIPFVGIHAITDTAEEDIPALEIINPFLASSSPWRYPQLFWDIARKPRFVVDLLMLNHDAQVAGRGLTHFLNSNRANLGAAFARLKIDEVSQSVPAEKEVLTPISTGG